ncbi:MAG: chaperone NapD [Paracoccus sp. (in: a-proteobacteria)]|uniref:chaperone NapD n=1 Tax=Paracoccus sp. TaxID=267 RepID=UPI0026DFAC29|nr:chaperone NapD [Paracoccus sp. (in: a-proteobacteria)]MDO5622102.1 chaperone NapD [Paracoccus sp. (in: a-proteobacteria)]
MNICGCLVHVMPAATDAARATMETMAGVEIHAADDAGRMVVVVEDTPDQRASEIIMALHQIPGVLSVTLNYHHFEDLSQTAPHARHTSRRTVA